MIRMIVPVLLVLLLPLPPVANAQTAAKIVVVDFGRAIAECAEGKQAAQKWDVKFEERKKDIETRQKALETAETQLRTQERVLSDAIKAEKTRDIERQKTELTRINEDAQKELATLREELLRPIAEKATAVMKAFATEQGFTIVIDISGESSVVHASPASEVTAELVKRINAVPKPTPIKPPGI